MVSTLITSNFVRLDNIRNYIESAHSITVTLDTVDYWILHGRKNDQGKTIRLKSISFNGMRYVKQGWIDAFIRSGEIKA